MLWAPLIIQGLIRRKGPKNYFIPLGLCQRRGWRAQQAQAPKAEEYIYNILVGISLKYKKRRKVREVSSSESSENDQISCQSDGNGQKNKTTAWLSDEEPPFKDFTKVLKDTGKESRPINRLSELIKTLWQQKEPLDQLKDGMDTYDPPRNCQKLAIKYCNEEIWNRCV